MNDNDKLTTLATAMLEPAQAGGVSQSEAKAIYNTLMEAYTRLQHKQPKFADALVREMGRAVAIASGSEEAEMGGN